MLLILVHWLFIFITLLGSGYLLLSFIKRFLGITEATTSLVFILITGLFFVTITASIVSFFAPVNEVIRYIVFLISISVIIFHRSFFILLFRNVYNKITGLHWLSKFVFFTVVLIAIIKSAGPSELIDEGGYYLPYIRWIEEFPLTPGLANIEDRMGFNSTFHLLCAFFSMRELFADGLYDLNGFLLILFAAYFVGGFNSLVNFRSEMRVVDIVKTFCLYFLFRNMLTSSSVDLANVFIAEMALVLFIEKITSRDKFKTDEHFVIIFLLTVLLTTIKLSSFGLLLLPAYLLFFSGSQLKKCLIFTAGTGLTVMVLWLTRFYFLTGYLVYPVYHIDLFNPQWKVPFDIVRTQYYYVKEFARLNAAREISEALSKSHNGLSWVPGWFEMQNAYNKITAIVLLLCTIVFAGLIAKGKIFRSNYFYLFSVLVVNILLWFLTFPAFRFGWAFIIVFIAMIISLLFLNSKFKMSFRYAVIIVCLIFTIQSFYKTIQENGKIISATLMVPVTMPVPETKIIELSNGFNATVTSTDECWGASPPCFPDFYNRNVRNIGPNPQDGYYILQQN